MNTAVAEMDKVTQQNAASAEESASASEETERRGREDDGLVVRALNMVGGHVGHAKISATRSRRQKAGAQGSGSRPLRQDGSTENENQKAAEPQASEKGRMKGSPGGRRDFRDF